jgi:hypothetical protein
MDQTKSLEKAYEAVDDQLQAWKDAGRGMALYSKQLDERQAAQLVREQMSARAALAAPTLAANIGKGLNSTALMGSLQGIEAQRKLEDQTQRQLAFLHAAREKRLDYLKGQFPNIFHYMEVNDLARPSCIANFSDEILRSISTNLGQHRVKTFHPVSMGGGTYMALLPHEVDFFELKLGPESAATGWRLVRVTAIPSRRSRPHGRPPNVSTSIPGRHTEIWLLT